MHTRTAAHGRHGRGWRLVPGHQGRLTKVSREKAQEQEGQWSRNQHPGLHTQLHPYLHPLANLTGGGMCGGGCREAASSLRWPLGLSPAAGTGGNRAGTHEFAELNLMRKVSCEFDSESMWVEVPGCYNYLCGCSHLSRGLGRRQKALQTRSQTSWRSYGHRSPVTLRSRPASPSRFQQSWQRPAGLSWPRTAPFGPWEAGSLGSSLGPALSTLWPCVRPRPTPSLAPSPEAPSPGLHPEDSGSAGLGGVGGVPGVL